MQLHNTIASKGKKKMKYHVSTLVEQLKVAAQKKFATWIFLLSVQLFHIS